MILIKIKLQLTKPMINCLSLLASKNSRSFMFGVFLQN